jgi:hypothetical protein
VDVGWFISFRIRLIGWLKRSLFRIINFRPNLWTSIFREERPINSVIEIGSTLSEPVSIQILDPRSQVNRGFFFNTRVCFVLHKAIVEPFQGLIWTDSKVPELIKESTRWHPYVLQASFPVRPFRTNKETIPAGIILTSTPYWHWLIEDLPITIKLIENNSACPLIVSRKRPAYVNSFLSTTSNPMIEVDRISRIEKLYTADKGNSSGWPHPADIDILKNYKPFKNSIENVSDRKIYVSRKHSKRSPKNEHEVETLFAERGFEIHYFENINIFEQIKICSSAKILAGIHGAGLSNMIWMSKGAKVLDIYNENYWTESFHRCASVCELQYLHFGYKGRTTDSVDVEELTKYLGTNL